MAPSNPSAAIALTIVIPAYNEGDNLGPVLDDTIATLNQSASAQPYELVVINDGSRDHTGRIADDYAARYPCVRVFHHPTNLGFGTALRTGFTNSRGKYVSLISADGEIKADQVVGLLTLARDADYVTSSRVGFAGVGQPKRRALIREFLTWSMRVVSRLVLGFDPSRNSGIYLVRGDLLRALPLRCTTGLVGLEICLHCTDKKVSRRHGEMEIHPRLSGRSKVATFRGVLSQLIEMMKIRWYLHTTRGRANPPSVNFEPADRAEAA